MHSKTRMLASHAMQAAAAAALLLLSTKAYCVLSKMLTPRTGRSLSSNLVGSIAASAGHQPLVDVHRAVKPNADCCLQGRVCSSLQQELSSDCEVLRLYHDEQRSHSADDACIRIGTVFQQPCRSRDADDGHAQRSDDPVLQCVHVSTKRDAELRNLPVLSVQCLDQRQRRTVLEVCPTLGQIRDDASMAESSCDAERTLTRPLGRKDLRTLDVSTLRNTPVSLNCPEPVLAE